MGYMNTAKAKKKSFSKKNQSADDVIVKADSVVNDRDKYIGGSDIAKVKTSSMAMRLVQEKQEPLKEFVSIYTEFGNIAEPIIRERINLELYGGEFDLEEDKVIIKEREGKLGLRGNLDGFDNKTNSVIEIKTLGQDYIDNAQKLKAKIEAYKIQNAFYQLLVGNKVDGNTKGLIYYLPRPDFLIDKAFSKWTVKEMTERRSEVEKFIATELLDDMVKVKCPLTKELFREIKRRVELVDKWYEKLNQLEQSDTDDNVEKLLNDYHQLDEQIKSLTVLKAKIEAKFAKKFNDERAWNYGDMTATFIPASVGSRTSFSSAKFKKEHEDLYNKYLKTSEVKRSAKLTIKIKE